jgi:hypothetical protein
LPDFLPLSLSLLHLNVKHTVLGSTNIKTIYGAIILEKKRKFKLNIYESQIQDIQSLFIVVASLALSHVLCKAKGNGQQRLYIEHSKSCREYKYVKIYQWKPGRKRAYTWITGIKNHTLSNSQSNNI